MNRTLTINNSFDIDVDYMLTWHVPTTYGDLDRPIIEIQDVMAYDEDTDQMVSIWPEDKIWKDLGLTEDLIEEAAYKDVEENYDGAPDGGW